MTPHRFTAILLPTIKVFWQHSFKHLTANEITYIRKTPAVRHALETRLLLALAHTFLTPDQISRFKNTEIQDLQTDFTLPSTESHGTTKDTPQ